jgi:hypothetical protein
MSKAIPRYLLEWDLPAEEEFAALRPFDARPILEAVRALRHQAEVETRNRKRLRTVIPSVPDATWDLRVADHRVLYEVRNHRLVRVLRVIFKGRLTMDEAAGGSRS